MNENVQDQGKLAGARRRLLKGGFAVPAALTLCSGSALAATSSICVSNAANAGLMPAPGGSVGYLRVEAYTTGNGAKTLVFIRGADVNLLVAPGKTSFLSAGQSIVVAAGNGGGGGANNQTGQNVGDIISTPSGSPSGIFYALLVDANGNIVGVSQVSVAAGSGAVTQSCWTSFVRP